MYPEELVDPMRRELTDLGFAELRTAKTVNQMLSQTEGTTLIVFNSVCGCAAGNARPAIKLAIKHKVKPSRLATVFAGQDIEAVAQARKYIAAFPPSSPAITLFKDGEPVFMLERSQIEGFTPEQISEKLIAAFDLYCA